MTQRALPAPHPADEKAQLIKDIRRRLPFVAIDHPGLAAEIERAMDMVEDKRGLPVRLLAEDQTQLGVGVEVVVMTSERQRQGIIVQMGDTDDDNPIFESADRVMVWEGADQEYPCWWSADIVVPLAKVQR